MPIRNIVLEGDACLLKKCRPISDFNAHIHTLLDDMLETLTDAHGAGLAAPQVGVLRQAAIVMLEDDTVVEIINPVIIMSEGEQDGPEGCLSIPDVRGMVKRPQKVTVRAQDRFGNWFEHTAEGFEARAFCHEIDHLNGRLYTELVTEYLDTQSDEEDVPEDMD